MPLLLLVLHNKEVSVILATPHSESENDLAIVTIVVM